VSVKAVFDVIDSGDPFLKAAVTKGKDVVNVQQKLEHWPLRQQAERLQPAIGISPLLARLQRAKANAGLGAIPFS